MEQSLESGNVFDIAQKHQEVAKPMTSHNKARSSVTSNPYAHIPAEIRKKPTTQEKFSNPINEVDQAHTDSLDNLSKPHANQMRRK